MPFGFYSDRLGAPISWVGLVYVAGAALALDPRRAAISAVAAIEPAEPAEPAEPGWPGKYRDRERKAC